MKFIPHIWLLSQCHSWYSNKTNFYLMFGCLWQYHWEYSTNEDSTWCLAVFGSAIESTALRWWRFYLIFGCLWQCHREYSTKMMKILHHVWLSLAMPSRVQHQDDEDSTSCLAVFGSVIASTATRQIFYLMFGCLWQCHQEYSTKIMKILPHIWLSLNAI